MKHSRPPHDSHESRGLTGLVAFRDAPNKALHIAGVYGPADGIETLYSSAERAPRDVTRDGGAHAVPNETTLGKFQTATDSRVAHRP